MMQGYLAALSIVLLLGMVVTRVVLLDRAGTRAFHFGNIDKTDFLIPPIALFYFYTVFAAAFGWPFANRQRFFESGALAWVGVLFCGVGLVLLFLTLVSFGRSFRVGIDVEQPDELVTTGVFGFSRNPIYVAFGSVLLGQFLVFPNWVTLIAFLIGVVLFHRQVLREEAFLRQQYGQAYVAYCKRVRRYF